MKFYITTLTLFIFLLSACREEKPVTAPADYDLFMKDGLLSQRIECERHDLAFWQHRLQQDTGNFVDLSVIASIHFRLYRLTGNPGDLRIGDSLLKRSSARLKDSDPDLLFTLSQQAITLHHFREASVFNEAASKSGGDPFIATLLQFDSGIELGDIQMAAGKLETLEDKSSFDYLTRKARMTDQQGNLEEAIGYMEQAVEKVKDRNPNLFCWALSNLADMYGHAGRIRESYEGYLEVLQRDPANFHALKGIAWIVYSLEGNTTEAKRILHYILSQVSMPDIWLVLAEIAEFEGNLEEKAMNIRHFLRLMENPDYGEMYNRYLVEVYATEVADHEKALSIASEEVTSRPTPETYDGLAWVYFNMGQKEKAIAIARNNVWRRTFEPGVAWHVGLIFAANGMSDEAKILLEDCLESCFELGPLVTKKIREELYKLP